MNLNLLLDPGHWQDAKIGTPIGIAGYPSFQIGIAKDLANITPSFHFGRLNAREIDDIYLEFDALADHGNSGGPMFDEKSGDVYGVVTLGIQSKVSSAVQNNLAISAEVVSEFLEAAFLPREVVWEPGTVFDPEIDDPTHSHGVMVPCAHSDPRWQNPIYTQQWNRWCTMPDAVAAKGAEPNTLSRQPRESREHTE